jgi:hypothetical protein
MKRKKTQGPDARMIVEGLSESELRALVLDRLGADPELESIILSRFVKGKGLKTLERLFDLALDKAGEPEDYDSWDCCYYSDLMADLEKIEKEAANALSKGDHARGLQAYFMLIERVATMSNEGDDHDGSLMDGVNGWMEALENYAGGRRASPEGLKLLRDWARGAEVSFWAKKGDSWDESCRQLLIRSARGVAELRTELGKAIRLADVAGKDWHDEYRSKQAALNAIDLFKRIKDSAGRRAFIDSHLHISDVRLIAIDEVVEQMHFEEAESLAREGIAHTKAASRDGTADTFSERVWEILRKAGKHEAAGAFELESFLDTRSDKWYKRLEQRHRAIWTEYREGLLGKAISAGFDSRTLADIYATERLYDRLLDLCQKNSGLYEEHYRRLGGTYPIETAAWLKNWIERNSRQAQSRSFYADIGKKIGEYGGYAGAEAAQALVDSLFVRYANRPAMRQEFTKALKMDRGTKSGKSKEAYNAKK